jgi:hypothetical protein
MLKLRVVQAEFGDCLILEYGTVASPRYILIDGGPDDTYGRHLKGELENIGNQGGKLDMVVLSHVDNDHVIGLLDLFAELRDQRANGAPATIAVGALWHNSFSRTIDTDNTIQSRLASLAAVAGQTMTVLSMAVKGIAEGGQLRTAATQLGISINPEFANDLVSVDEAPAAKKFGNLSLWTVGPTKANLAELKAKWEQWLQDHTTSVTSGDPYVMANSDRSVPNLSSIMLLAEADRRRILLTGDGRSDHLLQGLKQANFLGPSSALHVDVLKLPHHGSDRNVTKKFFKTVTADHYVASANGKDDNPDLATLIWVVETAKEQGRQIEIHVTNATPSTQQLTEDYDPATYGYQIRVMSKTAHSLALDLAP